MSELEKAVKETAKYILNLGLHQYGGYTFDNKNCEKIAVDKINTLIQDEVRKATTGSLDDYSRWLEKRGYMDSDWYAEEPNAIDEYISQLSKGKE